MNADFERRFGGLRRLYGVAGAQAIFDSHVMVVGIGGVGAWAAEALARSGVGRLTLVDMDHVAESNINRQIHALTDTVGMAKVEAMRERIVSINPECRVEVVDDFVTADNWPAHGHNLLAHAGPLGLIDACDQVRAKTAMSAWAVAHRVNFVSVGAAGGKRKPQAIEVGDLAEVTHDPLLAQLRYRLRREHGASRTRRMGVTCVFSREPVAPPDASCDISSPDGSLNCHGYGSVVSVTASFGLCAAGCVFNALADAASNKPVKLSKQREMTL